MNTTVTWDFLNALAAKLGTKVISRRYRMWNYVPHIGETALVVDNIVERGGYRIIGFEEFPRKITPQYIAEAVRNKAVSLGELDLSNGCVFRSWRELKGSYPPGYFTHRVGEDVSGE